MKRVIQRFSLVAVLLVSMLTISVPNSVAANLPVTSGLLANFTADNYNASTKVWTNSASGGSSNATASGSPTLVSISPNTYLGNTQSFQAVQGVQADSINFGMNALPATYTFFSVARYNPVDSSTSRYECCTNAEGRNRIFTSIVGNWLSGFWAGLSGVSYHEGWTTVGASDSHHNQWVLSSDVSASTYRAANYRSYSDSVTVTSNTGVSDSVAHGLIINGGALPTETSRFQVAAVISYNRVLTAPEVKVMEAYLSDLYGIRANVPSVITVSAGNNQSAAPASQVATAPAVLVVDNRGVAVESATVTFAIASGGGSLASSGIVYTNTSGIATSPAWTLGPSPGSNTLTASTTYVSNTTFTETATDTVAPTSVGTITALYTNTTSVSVGYVASDSGTITSVAAYYSTSAALTSPSLCGSVTSAATSGTITCTIPATNTTYYIYTRATDSASNVESAPSSADDSIVKNDAISLAGTTQTLSATYGRAASDTVTATLGTGTKTFVLTGTSNAGITIDTTTANRAVLNISSSVVAGTYYETMTATDTLGATATYAITVTVASAISLAGTTQTLSATYGQAASDTVTATLGTGTKTFALTGTSNAGITIDTTTANRAVLNVANTVAASTYYETITATDTLGANATYSITLTVSKADTLTITAGTLSPLRYSGSQDALVPTNTTSGLASGDSISGLSYSYSASLSSLSNDTCENGGVCVIGNTAPGGGVVFFVSDTVIDVASGISTGGTYLATAPLAWNSGVEKMAPWGCSGTNISGTVGTIGSGASNTLAITNNACSLSTNAAALAADLTYGGYSDWFLPSGNEVSYMYTNLKANNLGSFSNNNYWSSTQSTGNPSGQADYVWFGSGATGVSGGTDKNNSSGSLMTVRPIRAFSRQTSVTFTYGPTSSKPTNVGTYVITPSAVTFSGSGSTLNYSAVVYVAGSVTIVQETQTALSVPSLLGVFSANPSTITLYTTGGSDTGTVTFALNSGGSATGCALSGENNTTLSVASAGTCLVTATKAATTNYLVATASGTITFYAYQTYTTQSYGDSGSHTIVLTGGGTPWSVVAGSAPSISGISLASGPVGTVITISGTGFNGVTVVQINREDMASFTGLSPTSISATIQGGATSGPIYVENAFGGDFYFSGFTVTS